MLLSSIKAQGCLKYLSPLLPVLKVFIFFVFLECHFTEVLECDEFYNLTADQVNTKYNNPVTNKPELNSICICIPLTFIDVAQVISSATLTVPRRRIYTPDLECILGCSTDQ